MMNVQGIQIDEVLYKGASIWVGRGHRNSDQSRVLVKIPKEEALQEDIARLRHEYLMLSKLTDSGGAVRPILEEIGGQFQLVEEDPGGVPLDRALAEGLIDLSTFLWVAVRLAEIVQGIHHHNIIHQDIHSRNILVDVYSKKATLLTYSFATRLTRDNGKIVNARLLRGALPYISPEQTGRMNRSVDYRTDLYSLGVILYELVTGCLPFQSADPMEVVHAHIAKNPTPPHELDPTVPPVVSEIILKLLAKNAEDRYQSSYGLLVDLLKCVDRLDDDGGISPFVIGSKDFSQQLNIPEKLYGRGEDLRLLITSFENISAGRAEILLVSGYSGIGKTALVREVYRPMTGKRGYFISGKCEQHKQNIAYFVFVQAFQDMSRQLLTESVDRLAYWKQRLLKAFDGNGQVIMDVIPEIELVVGEQPNVPELAPGESENRFRMVFQSFLRVFTRESHPLTIFFDDLQWADSASLNLIHFLADQDDLRHLLLIGAFRDNEVMPGHPLNLALDEIRKTDVVVHEVSLAPLVLEDIEDLVSDTLGRDVSDVQELAVLLSDKTGGNPFFLRQFLGVLHDDGFLVLDSEKGVWKWDVDEIRRQDITDNVAELVAEKLRTLDPGAQDILAVAACIGNRFDLDTLVSITGRSWGGTAQALWPVAQQRFIVPFGDNNKITENTASGVGMDLSAASVSYRFLHDRVHEAASDLISEERRKHIHHEIGYFLMKGATEREIEERIFEIVNHLNSSRDLIEDPARRRHLARLNLLAGRKARSSAAYALALENLIVGLEVMGPDGWVSDYGTTLELHRIRSECEYCIGNLEEANRLLDVIIENALELSAKIDTYRVKATLQRHATFYDEGIRVGLEGLALLGVNIPFPGDAQELEPAIEHESVELARYLEGREIDDLVELPNMIDPDLLVAMDLLEEMSILGMFFGPDFLQLVALKMINLSLEHGNCGVSAVAFASYGTHLCWEQDFKRGFLFGEVGLKLSRNFGNSFFLCKAGHWFASYVYHWQRPILGSLPILRESFVAGMRSGDPAYASYSAFYVCLHSLYGGRSLEDVDRELCRYMEHFDPQSRNALVSYLEMVRCFRGLEMDAGSPLMGDDYAAMMKDQGHVLALQHYYTNRMILQYFLGDVKGAHRLCAEAAEAGNIEELVRGQIVIPEHLFVRALISSELLANASPDDASPDDRAEMLRVLEEVCSKMRRWSEASPRNFRHKFVLLSAETSRHEGRQLDAMRLYDEAIDGALRFGFIRDYALANERAANLYLECDLRRSAQVYMQKACKGYRMWGANRKVEMLFDIHPLLVSEDLDQDMSSDQISADGLSLVMDSDTLDLGTILKASRTISGEIVLERLLGRMLRICIENAGAQRGVLIFERDGVLLIQAEGSVDDEDFIVLQGTPIGSSDCVPVSVVEYVWRTNKTVGLDRVGDADLFQADSYFEKNKPKSILCLGTGKQTGQYVILYLENNRVEGAFSPRRVRVLEILAAQAAISLENALHYDTLEHKVEKRTLEIRSKNRELEETLQRLKETQDRLVIQERLASLGALTAGVAHELKNPMNFVNNFSEISVELAEEVKEIVVGFKDRLPEDDAADLVDVIDDLTINLTKIAGHGKRADGIIHSMLLHSHSGTAKRRDTILNELVEEYVNLAYHGFQSDQTGFDIVIERDYDKSVGSVHISSQEVGRVVLNLVNNSCHAVAQKVKREADPEFSPVIRVATRRANESIYISVYDNGTGIPEEIQGKILDPFFTTKEAGEGTGLGLSISYDIVVKGYGGDFRFDSQEGEHTEFLITLPATG